MNAYSYSLPRQGNDLSEYEDAFASGSVDGLFAIADGASGSLFQGVWARLLVEQFVRTPVCWERGWEDWLLDVQQQWIASLSGRTIDWNEEEKFEQGAMATFLALRIDPATNTSWWSLAIGDSCLFHVRDEKLLTAFPVSSSHGISTTTKLIGSRTPVHAVISGREAQQSGQCQVGDFFFLATDALARWFLEQCESGCQPWQTTLEACRISTDSFSAWIESLRSLGTLMNDDVTLVVVEV